MFPTLYILAQSRRARRVYADHYLNAVRKHTEYTKTAKGRCSQDSMPIKRILLCDNSAPLREKKRKTSVINYALCILNYALEI